MSSTVDIDLTYAISEIQDLQGAQEVTAERLEGIEARLKEVVEALVDYGLFAPGNPHTAGKMLQARLRPTE